MPKPPPKRTATVPGLGLDGVLARLDSAEMRRVRKSFEKDEAGSEPSTPPPSSRSLPSVPREDADGPASGPPSDRYAARAKTGSFSRDEHPSGPRARTALTVDSVGDAATRIARTTRQTSPKLIATPATIAGAPLDSRSAFVLSLVDGTSDVPAIVDGAGMPADEVIGILARLARLGLISVP